MIPGLLDGIILQIVIKSNAPSLANVESEIVNYRVLKGAASHFTSFREGIIF